MNWEKKGLIFKTSGNLEWSKTHTQVPVAMPIEDKNILRIYYGTRDGQNRTRTSFIDVDGDNFNNILYVHKEPILDLGNLGCFDDSGAMPAHVIKHGNKIYLYYTGWNSGNTARYRVSDGLAISEDGGTTFQKISNGPILDRSIVDPISTSIQSVIYESGIWKAWYLSYTKWEMLNGIAEPFYHIKYVESEDGIHWNPKNIVCIDYKSDEEGGIGVPTVIKDKDTYKMWYSYRNKTNYRDKGSAAYKIGYAESADGIVWIRMDDQVGINVSEEGWDSEMVAYANVFYFKNKLFMLYNGNGFGQSGFGYAISNLK